MGKNIPWSNIPEWTSSRKNLKYLSLEKMYDYSMKYVWANSKELILLKYTSGKKVMYFSGGQVYEFINKERTE